MKILPSAVDAFSGREASLATRRTESKFRLVLAVAWTLFVMVICWLPRPVVVKVEGDGSLFRVPNFDKLVHCGVFVLFTILWVRAFPQVKRTWIVIVAIAFMLVTELVQTIPVIGREATIGDGLADTVGAVIGVWATTLVEPWMQMFDRYFVERIWRVSKQS